MAMIVLDRQPAFAHKQSGRPEGRPLSLSLLSSGMSLAYDGAISECAREPVAPIWVNLLEEPDMPIMSARQKNDARGTVRLLAVAARDTIRGHSTARREVVLNNVYRLLEAYRSTAFFGLEPSPRPYSARAAETISLLPRAERNVNDVKVAIEAAQAKAFPGRSKDQAIEAVANVLRGIVYPADFAKPTNDEVARAGDFFDEFVERLSA
jgi:hypothetical protein